MVTNQANLNFLKCSILFLRFLIFFKHQKCFCAFFKLIFVFSKIFCWWPKIGKNQIGHLGRYENSNEARKNVLRSWDHDLSICNVKRVLRDRKNIKMVNMLLDFGTGLSTYYCWRSICLCFGVCEGSESATFVATNKFSFRIWSQIVTNLWGFLIFTNFSVSKKILNAFQKIGIRKKRAKQDWDSFKKIWYLQNKLFILICNLQLILQRWFFKHGQGDQAEHWTFANCAKCKETFDEHRNNVWKHVWRHRKRYFNSVWLQKHN